MKVYGKTDVGKVRESNQDNMVFRQLDEGCLYAVVCDGMGTTAATSLPNLP